MIADGKRTKLLALLQGAKAGLAADALAGGLGITITAVRQHLVSLERDGLVGRGDSVPSGGRPQQLFVLTDKGRERFPRQYSWFAAVLLDAMRAEMGGERLQGTLRLLGQDAARSAAPALAPRASFSQRAAALAARMRELGYDADHVDQRGSVEIVARNCVFHQLAHQHPEVCAFDLGLIGGVTGAAVDHDECIVRGGVVCRFRLTPRR